MTKKKSIAKYWKHYYHIITLQVMNEYGYKVLNSS